MTIDLVWKGENERSLRGFDFPNKYLKSFEMVWLYHFKYQIVFQVVWLFINKYLRVMMEKKQ